MQRSFAVALVAVVFAERIVDAGSRRRIALTRQKLTVDRGGSETLNTLRTQPLLHLIAARDSRTASNFVNATDAIVITQSHE